MRSTIVHTKKTAAARASISLEQLNKLIRRGEGPSVVSLGARRVGIADDDLADWIAARRKPAPIASTSTAA